MAGDIYTNDGFFHASVARNVVAGGGAAGSADVLKEINTLQEAVINAALAGSLSTTVSNSIMASSTDYYNSWANYQTHNTDADKVRLLKMDRVIRYFVSRGYSINRNRIGTSDAFEWKIEW